MNAQIGENISFVSVDDSLGAYRRAHVLKRSLCHASGSSNLHINWGYVLHGETRLPDVTSRSQMEPICYVAALPMLRSGYQNRTIGSVVDKNLESIWKQYGNRICGSCKTLLPESPHKVLLEYGKLHPESVLLLSLCVSSDDPTSNRESQYNLRDLIDMLLAERVIMKNGSIVRADNDTLDYSEVALVVLDSARGAMLLSSIEQLGRWNEYIDKFGTLKVSVSGDKGTAREAATVISERYCGRCGLVRDSASIVHSLDGVLATRLEEASFNRLRTALEPIPMQNISSDLIGYLCKHGFSERLWGDSVTVLDDRSFALLLFISALSASSLSTIFLEGFYSFGFSESDIRDAGKLFSKSFFDRQIILYDVSEKTVPDSSSSLSEIHRSGERLVDIYPVNGTRIDSLGTLSGILKVAGPLFASTQASRMRGFRSEHFSFKDSQHFCALCDGVGSIAEDLYAKCEACQGTRISDSLGDIKYHGISYRDLISITLDDLLGRINDPILHDIVNILISCGLGSARLQDSWKLFDKGELTRIHLISKLLTSNQKGKQRKLFIATFLSWGLSMQGAQNAIESLAGCMNSGFRIYGGDNRPEVQQLLSQLMR